MTTHILTDANNSTLIDAAKEIILNLLKNAVGNTLSRISVRSQLQERLHALACKLAKENGSDLGELNAMNTLDSELWMLALMAINELLLDDAVCLWQASTKQAESSYFLALANVAFKRVEKPTFSETLLDMSQPPKQGPHNGVDDPDVLRAYLQAGATLEHIGFEPHDKESFVLTSDYWQVPVARSIANAMLTLKMLKVKSTITAVFPQLNKRLYIWPN